MCRLKASDKFAISLGLGLKSFLNNSENTLDVIPAYSGLRFLPSILNVVAPLFSNRLAIVNPHISLAESKYPSAIALPL